jgi:hypothetical protein
LVAEVIIQVSMALVAQLEVMVLFLPVLEATVVQVVALQILQH